MQATYCCTAHPGRPKVRASSRQLCFSSLLRWFHGGCGATVTTLALQLGIVIAQAQQSSNVSSSSPLLCYPTTPFDAARHRETYRVGVLAIRGKEAAYREFNQTFADYLTATAGRRFADPPIRFEMVPLDFVSLYEIDSDNASAAVDFLYVNPSAFSCLESEHRARSLASQVSRRTADGGQTYHDLNRFGGVILARADNSEVQTVTDLRDKVIAAASISGLGSGQMQFRVMQENGLSYINDPRQLVFTSNQATVVNGVLSGRFDVGFVRTDQMGQTQDMDGNLIDRSLLKVIDPIPDLDLDGAPFPFQSSTMLYPEWNLAALPHVPEDVAQEVQHAMLRIAHHARAADAWRETCRNHNQNATTTTTSLCAASAESSSSPEEDNDDFASLLSDLGISCEVTRQSAQLAREAMDAGNYSGWTTTLSYLELRSMQMITGFIELDPSTNLWRCIRSTEIYDFIACPAGHVKKSRAQVEAGCAEENLPCGGGDDDDEFQCICRPCYRPNQCGGDAVELVAGRCVPFAVLLPCTILPSFAVLVVVCYCLLSHKSKQMVRQAETAAENERELNEFIAFIAYVVVVARCHAIFAVGNENWFSRPSTVGWLVDLTLFLLLL